MSYPPNATSPAGFGAPPTNPQQPAHAKAAPGFATATSAAAHSVLSSYPASSGGWGQAVAATQPGAQTFGGNPAYGQAAAAIQLQPYGGNPASATSGGWGQAAAATQLQPYGGNPASATSGGWGKAAAATHLQAYGGNPEPSRALVATQPGRQPGQQAGGEPSATALYAATSGAASAFTGQTDVRKLTELSNKALSDAATGDGVLSAASIQKQMVVVENLLGDMVTSVRHNTSQIGATLTAFVAQVAASNQKVGIYVGKILDRAIEDDPKLTGEEVVKATAIVNLSVVGITAMKTSSEAAIELAKKAAGTVNDQTLVAIKTTFEARTLQVKLYGELLEVFRGQETHNLKIALQVHEVRMKEQQMLFSQLQEVVKLREMEREGASKRELEQRKADLEQRKAELEAAIQMRAQMLKEEQVQLEHQLKTDTLVADTNLKIQALKDAKQLEERLAEIKALEVREQGDTNRLKIHEDSINQRVKIQEDSFSQRMKIQEDSKNQQAKTAADERVANVKAVTDIFHPPCSVM
jgi:hypothetical protein